jgi:hypothetical protein
MEGNPRPTTTSRRRRRPRPGTVTGAAAAAAALVLGLLAASSCAGVAAAQGATAGQTNMVIQAVPDSKQLSSKGSQAGCDHYRNGYLGLALCVNFYDDHADGALGAWADRKWPIDRLTANESK